MLIITLGITVLLARLFPFGSQLLQMSLGGMYSPFFGKVSPIWFHVAMLSANYVLAIVVAIIFVRKAQLRSRLPKEIPGKTPTVVGLILIVLYLIPRLFASTIEGGGAAFVVSSFGPFFLIPANILIVIGVTKALLAALPQLPNHSIGSAKKTAQGR
jgi:hypothetical protein